MQSSRLPDSWVDSLITRLESMYGSGFVAMWENTSAQDMRNLWAEALARFSGEQIKWALGALIDRGTAFPPSLPEFAALCRQAPRPQQPALPAPVVDPAVAKERAQAIATQFSAFGSNVGHKRWAKDILENPKAYPPISLKLAKEALCDASVAEK